MAIRTDTWNNKYKLVTNRSMQNEAGKRIVSIRAVFNEILKRTASYCNTKAVFRREYHIFIHIEIR